MSTKTFEWTNQSILILGSLIIAVLPFGLLRVPHKFLFTTALLALFFVSQFWQSQVTRIVPEPYLDEIFHIPQAQAYCQSQYEIWDPKLTTPPGLYALSVLLLKISRGACTVGNLRFFNVLSLLSIMILSFYIRQNLTSRSHSTIGKENVHTALNIALFPPLFFFSGLYYTDVASTLCVLLAYQCFLNRSGAKDNSGRGLWINYLVGMLALTMRQTNIFWVAVFLGGSEAIRTLEANISPAPISAAESVWKRWARGDIHDIPLEDAGFADFILMPISLAVAVLCHPILILTRLWPDISLLISFALFVLWNGGVVLGDKSNHIPTLHTPQLLYLLPFLTFFSLPLMLPHLLTSLLHPRTLSPYLPLYLLLLSAASLLPIHYNTIIHPFTLADNRHYIFYVFRYSILRYWWMRYALAPVYIVCGWGVWGSLLGTSSPTPPNPLQKGVKRVLAKTTKAAQNSHNKTPKISTLLLILLPTILSLITAPLVEPRYFILPWVFYRLNIPSSTSTTTTQTPEKSPEKRTGITTRYLCLETLWFLAINAGTGYMFLYRGFEWKQEPGKVQRFMW